MSVDYSSPDIQTAVDAFHAGISSWVVLGYTPQRDRLVLLASGSDLNGCRRQLDEVGEEVAYAFVREATKTGVITYLGEGVGGVKRARALVHGRLLSSNLFTPNGGSFTINASSELTAARLVADLDEISPPPTPQRRPSPSPIRSQSPPSSTPSSATIKPPQPPPIETGASTDAMVASSSSRPRTPETAALNSPLISATSPSPSQTTRNIYTPPASAQYQGFGAQQEQQLGRLAADAESSSSGQQHHDGYPRASSSSPAGSDGPISPPPSSASGSAAAPSPSNPISRLAQLESQPSASSTNPLPPTPVSPQPAARSPGGIGRPSIPLFSSLSLSARKPTNGDNAANTNGSTGRGRITSFGSLRERFSSRSRTASKGTGASVDEGDGPPALPPKDTVFTPIHHHRQTSNSRPGVSTADLFPIAVDNGPSFESSMDQAPTALTTAPASSDGHGTAPRGGDRAWEDAYDDGYGYSISPTDGPSASIGAAALGRANPQPGPVPSSIPMVEEDGEPDERRVSSSTFGRPGAADHGSTTFDAAGSPPVPMTTQPVALAATPDVTPHSVPSTSASPSSAVQRVAPNNGSLPPSASLESIIHRRRPSQQDVGSAPAADDEAPQTAHWLQSREDERREDDNALLPQGVASRRAASGQPGSAGTVDPWDALDARRAEREAVRLRVEAEARERKRLREVAAEREAKERALREEERVRAARERTKQVERERQEKEDRERREREQVEEAKRQREKAREGSAPPTSGAEGGRLADGWLTVQAPNTVIFRRRFFHILPSVIHLYKDSTSTATPIATIDLPSSAAPAFSDAYEETQVLHSFGITDASGDVWLAYLDSESDKELVVAAMTIASQ